jgi:predicted metal-dependent peptidase
MNIKGNSLRRLKAARKALVLDHPFFGSLALRMNFKVETLGRTRTLGTDGRDIYYASDYVQGCSDTDLVGLIAHEVMHPAMQHHTRRGDRDVGLWNKAADYAINPILVEAGLSLPDGILLNPGFKGMTAEQIYEALRQPPGDGGDGEDEQQEESGAGGGAAEDSGDGSGHADESQQDSEDETDPADSEDDQDGVADLPGAVFDAPDPEIQEAEWQVALKQATQVAQMMGKLPGGVALAIEQVSRPQLDWRAILRRFVQQCSSADFSWQRPNRRYIQSGLYLPEVRSDALPPIVVVVDSSGSTLRVLPLFQAELQSIVDEADPEATIVIMADAAVQRVDRFERGDPIEFNVAGLGGTDFRPAFEYVDREQLHPACLIYLTDGDGTYPDEPSDFPTLWVITTPDASAPWGETVALEAEGA